MPPQKHTMNGSAEYFAGEGRDGTGFLPGAGPSGRLRSTSHDGYFTGVTEVPQPNQQPSPAGLKFGDDGGKSNYNRPYTQEFRHTAGHKRKRYDMMLSRIR